MKTGKTVVRDTSKRKGAEYAGLEQLRLSDVFFDHGVACLVILDRDFNFVRVNAAYARVCGRDIGEFAGRNHAPAVPAGPGDRPGPRGDRAWARHDLRRRRHACLRLFRDKGHPLPQ